MTEDLVYKIAFSSYRNVNLTTGRQFMARGITPEVFFTSEARALSSVTGLRAEVFSDARRRKALDEARREIDFIRAHGIKATFFEDKEYPRRLLECEDAPAMLYSIGKANLDSRHIISVVGTRHSTAYGLSFTSRLIADLASAVDDLLVVSGLAYGIDYAAHTAALREGVPTVGVVAHGLNTVYPADHRSTAVRMTSEGGGIVTEYRSCDSIHRSNFLARNRIVAGLADAVVIVESDTRGGAMTTAHLGMAYNREVLALPGRINDVYSRGCNNLIAGGGVTLLRDASDVIEVCGWTARKPEGVQQEMNILIDDTWRSIIDCLKANPDYTVNDLCAALGMTYSRLSSTLFEMEMEDLVVSLPGGKYGIVATV